MDLSKYNVSKMAEKGADLELLDPAGEPMLQKDGSPRTIKILGEDSKVWRNHNREKGRKIQQKIMRRGVKNVDMSISDEDKCEMLSICTIGWSGIGVNEDITEFSKEAAYKLYMSEPWVAEQVNEFITDRANFFTTA